MPRPSPSRRRLLLAGILSALALSIPGCGPGADSPDGARSTAPVRPTGKVLVLALDGADWDILDRLDAAGRIPNLGRLRAQGAHGVLRSERPLLSPIVWTTIATGRPPTEHGIHGFLTRRNGIDEPVRSDERNVRAFWNVATDLDVSVGVIGWYSSWPAEPVSGFQISDRVGAHQVTGSGARVADGLVYPAELITEVEALDSGLDDEVEALLDRFIEADATKLDAARLATLRGIVRTTELYRRLTPTLLKRFAPSLAAVYFEGTDAVGHLFAEFEPPRLPWVSDEEVDRYGAVFSRYYEYVDAIVGELLAEVDPETTTVMVISDHGFRSGERRPHTPSATDFGNQAPLWHRPEGVLILWGRGVRAETRLAETSLYDVLPTAFRLAGLPIARNLRGRPVDEALTEDILGKPALYVADYEAAGDRDRAAPPVADEDVSEQIEKLRALGYVGSSGSSAGAPDDGNGEGQGAIPLNRYNEAMILLNADRAADALGVSRELQAAAPASPMGFLAEGVVQLRLSKAGEAIEPLRAALRRNPELGTIHGYLGEALIATGRIDEARAALERALELDSANGRAALLLAQMRLRARRVDDARRWFEVARNTCDEASDQARANVGLAVLAEERREFDEASGLYEQAMRLVPDFPPALERFANLSLFRGDFSGAVGLLQRLVAQRPRSSRAAALLGRALDMAGRTDEARTELERSIALDPNEVEARRLLDEMAGRSAAGR